MKLTVFREVAEFDTRQIKLDVDYTLKPGRYIVVKQIKCPNPGFHLFTATEDCTILDATADTLTLLKK